MSLDPYTLTVARCGELMRRGEVSAVELTELFLARSEALNPQVNAFLLIDREGALAAARRSDDERRAGRDRGPLHGVPIALKDLYDTAGLRTTAGSKHFAGRVPNEDSHVVARLREAGAIVLGKLNMHEWALGATNINPHWGDCHNPWGLDRISGGSSGGTGAAIAAGMIPAGTGSDTGGSIRIPASLCGVTGLKPAYGRCSLRGVIPLAWTLDHPGPMARTAEDCALLLQAMAGYDSLDPFSVDRPVPDYTAGIDGGARGLRIGIAKGYFQEGCSAEIAAAVEEAARVLDRAGAVVSEFDAPMAREAAAHNGVILLAEAAAYHTQRLEQARDDFGEDVRTLLEMGAGLAATAYAEAERFRREFRRVLERDVFTRVDALLHPTTITTATPIAASREARQSLVRNTHPWNIAGTPVLALPCGFTSDGLPIGMSLAGPWWEEATLLRIGHAYQRLTGWHARHPQL